MAVSPISRENVTQLKSHYRFDANYPARSDLDGTLDAPSLRSAAGEELSAIRIALDTLYPMPQGAADSAAALCWLRIRAWLEGLCRSDGLAASSDPHPGWYAEREALIASVPTDADLPDAVADAMQDLLVRMLDTPAETPAGVFMQLASLTEIQWCDAPTIPALLVMNPPRVGLTSAPTILPALTGAMVAAGVEAAIANRNAGLEERVRAIMIAALDAAPRSPDGGTSTTIAVWDLAAAR